MPFRIIIVGGGIAGTAAAIALRGPNREITILEQSRLNNEIGATISLQPNATRILERTWGLTGLLKDVNGVIDHGFRIFNVEGKMVNEIPLLSKNAYEADRIIWHRQDIHNYLKQAATDSRRDGPPALVRTSSRVTRCDCERGEVTLESGETLTADLVIGADGIHSRIRSCVLGKEVTAVPTGTSAYRLMMPSQILESKVPHFTDRINTREPYTSMIMAHDCRLIMGPARGGELYSLVGLVLDHRMNEDPNSAQSWVAEGDLNKMLDTFTSFPDSTKDMFRQAESIGLWQLRDLDPLETWTKGRVILIGDAAHAMLPTQGQGASQAIEDAEALGALFADLDTDAPVSERDLSSILRRVFDCRHERASLADTTLVMSAPHFPTPCPPSISIHPIAPNMLTAP
ncbi:FAD binding domain-containing protein [Byssothecium circinans]|uniref:FAD binding domain-containing protein n=1 Tax=Byssothecium circinans TaxID=147558 RepID=A0A6A5TVH8_9PLEO|nr:FAD binding domain-containing protein [Byssothecium circinans]